MFLFKNTRTQDQAEVAAGLQNGLPYMRACPTHRTGAQSKSGGYANGCGPWEFTAHVL